MADGEMPNPTNRSESSGWDRRGKPSHATPDVPSIITTANPTATVRDISSGLNDFNASGKTAGDGQPIVAPSDVLPVVSIVNQQDSKGDATSDKSEPQDDDVQAPQGAQSSVGSRDVRYETRDSPKPLDVPAPATTQALARQSGQDSTPTVSPAAADTTDALRSDEQPTPAPAVQKQHDQNKADATDPSSLPPSERAVAPAPVLPSPVPASPVVAAAEPAPAATATPASAATDSVVDRVAVRKNSADIGTAPEPPRPAPATPEPVPDRAVRLEAPVRLSPKSRCATTFYPWLCSLEPRAGIPCTRRSVVPLGRT